MNLRANFQVGFKDSHVGLNRRDIPLLIEAVHSSKGHHLTLKYVRVRKEDQRRRKRRLVRAAKERRNEDYL